MLRLSLLLLLICFLTDAELTMIGEYHNATKPIPYLAQVRIYPYKQAVKICGGCIISQNWVLTAANCFDGGFDNIIRIAVVVNKVLLEDEAGQQTYEVPTTNVVLHSGYENNIYHRQNDIALLRTREPIAFSNSVKAARLPKKDQETYDKTGLLAGWGRMDDSTPYNSPIVRYTELPFITDKICKEIAIANYDLGYSSIFNTTSYVCTNSTKSMSCDGDIGSPVVIDPKNPIVVAIVSHHLALDWCKRGLPDIHMRVAKYLDWIKQISGVIPRVEPSPPRISSSTTTIKPFGGC